MDSKEILKCKLRGYTCKDCKYHYYRSLQRKMVCSAAVRDEICEDFEYMPNSLTAYLEDDFIKFDFKIK